MNRWLLVIIINSVLLGSCVTEEMQNPASKKIDVLKAREDIDIFIAVLQKAHPSLNLYISKKRFSFLSDSIKSSVTEEITIREFYNKINFLTNETGCSHTNAELADYVYDTLQNREFFFPYPVKWIDDKLLVNISGFDLPEGTEIKFINNEPVKKIIKKLMLYNSVEGVHRKTQENLAADNFSLEYFLKYGQQQNFELIIIDTLGSEKKLTENAINLSEWNNRDANYKYYYDASAVDYDFNINDEKGYAYLKMTTFVYGNRQKQRAYENFCFNSFELLASKIYIKSLIIDLRENRGGSLSNSFLLYSFLADKPFNEFEQAICKIKSIPYNQYLEKNFISNNKDEVNDNIEKEFTARLNNEFFTIPDTLIEKWQPNKIHYSGNVYVISNSTVVSAASYFAVMVKNAGRGKIIGEETEGGAYSGNGFTTLKYRLPNSEINFSFPYVHFIYTYKEQKNSGRGLKPDYTIPDSYESFKNNEDRQVKFIIDSLILNKNNFKSNE